jgi:Protein of unknown function (DUF3011)
MCDVVHSVLTSRSVFRMSMLLILAAAFLPDNALAQQAPANQSLPQVISCVSKKGERQVCPADTSAGVALLRSTGDSSCLLGKTWGYDNAGIWVSDGCGGEFAVGSTSEASGGSDFVGTFEPYGQLRTHLAAFNDTAEVQDNATRVGINFKTRGAIKMFAGAEWGVNLVQSETQFNLSASGTGDFGVVSTQTIQFSPHGLALAVSILDRWAGWPLGSRTRSTTMSPATRPTDSTCLAAREHRPTWRELTGEPRVPALPTVS